MLLIHKPRNHKLLTLGITSICSIGALLGLSVLTYTPELSRAEQVTYPSLSNITYMQDMTADICKHSHENETKQLIDSRDGKTYWVTKLKDENCWMTQNLDLDLYVDGANRKLTTADSDVTNDWTSTTGASGLWFPSDADRNIVKYYDPGEYAYTNPTNRLSSGCGALDGTTCAEAGWKLMSGASTDDSGNETTHYLAGNYYSWGTATAGQAATFGDSTTYPVESTQSICPKGWRLPTNTGNKSYNTLLTSYGTNSGLLYGTQDIRLDPLYLVYGGYVSNNSSLSFTGNEGAYWSSTAGNGSDVNGLSLTTYASPFVYWRRYLGLSVRCIARTEPPETRTLSDLTYMQDMTMDVCKNSEVGESKQLIDKRKNFNGTNPSYWVEKLKDNNCWMTQNLDLDIPAEGLKAEDTDIPVDWNSSSDYPPEATQITTNPDFGTTNNNIKSWDPAQGGTEKYCNTSGCNLTMSTNNGHDAQGNYYSWGAATAGQAAELSNFDISAQSVCPKGWRLPLSGDAWYTYNDVSGSFYNLLKKYGLSSGPSTNPETGYDIFSGPLYFNTSGYISSNLVVSIGEEGRYWSSVSHYNDSAYSLQYATTAHTDSSSIVRRYFGFSVRCVAPGGEKAIIDNNNIKVTINPQLTLDVASETIVNKTDTNPSTGDLKVKVSSNQPYVVELSSDDATMKSNTTSATIPAKSGLLNTAENGWGIMKHGASEYTAITNTPELFYQSASPEVKELLLKVGISTAPDIPNGEYSTDITITATQN